MSSLKVHYDACPLGHAKLETTALYTRVCANGGRRHARTIDVGYLQVGDLGHTEARAIGRR